MSVSSTLVVVEQLNKARDLAFTNKATFPQVLRQILLFVNNQNLGISKWCSYFFKESFAADESKLERADKIDLAIDSIDSLITLSNMADSEIFANCIDTSYIVFKLVFRYVSENDGCVDIWQKLCELKDSLVGKFETVFPLNNSADEEEDMHRSLNSKIRLVKFIILVIDYQSRSAPHVSAFSLGHVNLGHSLIKQSVEAEAHALLDILLGVINSDIIVTPLFTAVLNQLSLIVRKKPQFVAKICTTVDNFESNNKLQSNYESLEQFKLSRKFVDRVLRIFINHVLRNLQVPSGLSSLLSKKLNQLTSKGDEWRKKDILAPQPSDSQIKKRKFEGFSNPSKKLKSYDYRNLYCLSNPDDELSNFDLSILPQNVLISMILAALNKAKTSRVSKAVDLVKDRIIYSYENMDTINKTGVKKEPELGELEEDEDNGSENFTLETNYTLPTPKEFSLQDKKEHINYIIKNFFELAGKNTSDIDDNSNFNGEEPVNKDLTKLAIRTWNKDSWFLLLTRLASRGMRTVDTRKSLLNGSVNTNENSIDTLHNEEMSDLIRQAIFDHFLDNVHARIDLVVEWLNEEWYSEKVFNEDFLYSELTEKYLSEYESKSVDESFDINEKLQRTMKEIVVPTPTYNKWTGKVLDSLIPFLEPDDKKVFIRVLSDLPYLNHELVSRIKSLCYDPGRSKIGFLSLQFLIMYRPPVKLACLDILKELSSSDQEDLKDEATKLLSKY